MRIVMFYHSLISDWNHGNAHFLRGIVTELITRGHDVSVYEQKNAWSVRNLVEEHGQKTIEEFYKIYPGLDSIRYNPDNLDLNKALNKADLVIVHEWNDHDLVRRIGEHRASSHKYCLLFHDTHHRAITDKKSMAAYDLTHYDGVLAFGKILRDIYLREGWTKNAWVWHEAADTRVFNQIQNSEYEGDIVWIGNWGDDERTEELDEFLLEPVKTLGLRAKIYGVRYPATALNALQKAGIEYGGWLPNYKAAYVFSRYKLTVHVPRRPYAQALPGIPTIRLFEALACGIPLISAPWNDAEDLFQTNKDYLLACNGNEMKQYIKYLLSNPDEARVIAGNGQRTIFSKHTCLHRVDELLNIYSSIALDSREEIKKSVKIHRGEN